MPDLIQKELFKDRHVIFVTTHHCKPAAILACSCLQKILERREDALLVIIDNKSEEEIAPYLKSLRHDRIIKEFLDGNIGKARATNQFIAKYMDKNHLPRTVWSIDPDIIIDPLSFDYLLEAIENVPDNIKALGPRYKRNACNPEINIYFPPKNIRGANGKTYSIVFPFLSCVAGPVLVMRGETMRDLFNFRFFPTEKYLLYGNDDTEIYLKLRRLGLKSGYLNGTLAAHLRSGDHRAEEIKNSAK